jgi:hypothetical protein
MYITRVCVYMQVWTHACIYVDDLILESIVLPVTTLSILKCEVSCFQVRWTSFLVPEAGLFLDEFFKAIETILPIRRLTRWNRHSVNDSRRVMECDEHQFKI